MKVKKPPSEWRGSWPRPAGEDRAPAFTALGELAEVRQELREHADNIFVHVKDSISPVVERKKANSAGPGCVAEALFCVTRLVSAYGGRLNEYIRDLLPCLFEAGLGEPLAECLKARRPPCMHGPMLCI